MIDRGLRVTGLEQMSRCFGRKEALRQLVAQLLLEMHEIEEEYVRATRLQNDINPVKC